ncbi:competence protein CoiA [Oceanobacillus kapialis]|uniref:competence protein CoiA n=1 Tax=Oceanobacillus kapialis TaxID=481353 RepID=UPI00384C28DB
MLQAKSSEGKLITLATLTPVELQKLKLEKKQFTCPVCGNRVIVKAGLRVIPHFAHQQTDSCLASKQGEGAYHENGKLLLYQWLKSQQLQVKLEPYLPDIQQRPDILVSINNKTIAIEYQCARISPEIIQERNQGYQRAGIIPIWMMGEKLLKRKSIFQFKLDSFLQYFIHQFSTTLKPTLYFFCPYTTQLITIADIYSMGNGLAYGVFHVQKLSSVSFPHLFHYRGFLESELWRLWNKEKARFRLKPINQRGSDFKWHKWLYEHGCHRDYLPSIIHLPIQAQIFMKAPLWQWQSRVFLEKIAPLNVGSSISLTKLTSFISHFVYDGSAFPLIKPFHNPIEEYMDLLCKFGFFEKKNEKLYRKIRSTPLYSSLEDSIKGDQKLVLQICR